MYRYYSYPVQAHRSRYWEMMGKNWVSWALPDINAMVMNPAAFFVIICVLPGFCCRVDSQSICYSLTGCRKAWCWSLITWRPWLVCNFNGFTTRKFCELISKSKSKSKYVYFSRYIIYAHNLEHRGQNKINTLVYHIIYDVHHVTLAETHCFPIEFKIYDTCRPGPNGRYLADDIFKWIFLN